MGGAVASVGGPGYKEESAEGDKVRKDREEGSEEEGIEGESREVAIKRGRRSVLEHSEK